MTESQQPLEMRAWDEEKLRDAFELFDADKDGEINAAELQKVLRSSNLLLSLVKRVMMLLQIMNLHGIFPTEEELKEMIQMVDRNSNGTIDLEEFVQMMLDITKAIPEGEDDIEQAFKIFDKVSTFF